MLAVLSGHSRYEHGVVTECQCQFVYNMLRHAAPPNLGKLVTAKIMTQEELEEMTQWLFPWESAMCVADKVMTHQRCGGGRLRKNVASRTLQKSTRKEVSIAASSERSSEQQQDIRTYFQKSSRSSTSCDALENAM